MPTIPHGFIGTFALLLPAGMEALADEGTDVISGEGQKATRVVVLFTGYHLPPFTPQRPSSRFIRKPSFRFGQ